MRMMAVSFALVASLAVAGCGETTGARAGSGAAMGAAAVTWLSSIASSSAAWVFGGARLISSASTTFAKIGPSVNSNSPVCSR